LPRTGRQQAMATNWNQPDRLFMKLLHRAAGATEANSRQALATAQKLASQLRAAEDRIAELETEVQHYREKSERAEDWLRKISAEIEGRLFNEWVEKRTEVLRRP
jgi:cell fate (sporulation/competence/biofilm development) regulator YmcA (YheA/YmcA/DUF963 family)